MDEKTDEILKELDLAGKSEYEKAKAIYSYIAENVEYDYEHLDDYNYELQYTAYAALHDGTCVCAGYAQLLYVMMLKAGLDCRIIAGKAGVIDGIGFSDWEYHAWNIVKVDGKYYNCDSTWDSNASGIDFFLLSDASFNDTGANAHERNEEYSGDEFYKEFPMSEEDNPYEEDISGTCGKDGDNLK